MEWSGEREIIASMEHAKEKKREKRNRGKNGGVEGKDRENKTVFVCFVYVCEFFLLIRHFLIRSDSVGTTVVVVVVVGATVVVVGGGVMV